MDTFISTGVTTLRYTQHLLIPVGWDFMIFSFTVWLILISIIYLLPLFLRKYFPWIVRYPFIHDLIFFSSYSWIYMYWVSDWWDGLSQSTLQLFYWYMLVLFIVLMLSITIRRIYFTFNYKWIMLSYWIGLCLLFVWNALFELLDAIS